MGLKIPIKGRCGFGNAQWQGGVVILQYTKQFQLSFLFLIFGG